MLKHIIKSYFPQYCKKTFPSFSLKLITKKQNFLTTNNQSPNYQSIKHKNTIFFIKFIVTFYCNKAYKKVFITYTIKLQAIFRIFVNIKPTHYGTNTSV